MTNTISQGKMLSLVFLIKAMECLVSRASHVQVAPLRGPAVSLHSKTRKLRGTREVPLKVILGWTSIYTGSIQEEVFRIPNKITCMLV